MCLLTFDCGNSTIRARRSDGQIWSTSSRQPEFSGLDAFLSVVTGERRRALAVSVVPQALAGLRAALSSRGLEVEVAGVDLACPLRLEYETVATLGADRWLGAFAAHRAHGSAIVVDCGTATTVNVVSSDGCFHGGAIAPGLAAMVAGMASKAPALPGANLDASPAMPGRSTQASVDAGVLLGWVALVEGLVAAARPSAGPDAAIVVTGGNAQRLLRIRSLDAQHAPDLLHDGLRALAAATPANRS